jgi:membrane-associated phospholipid phosphatase
MITSNRSGQRWLVAGLAAVCLGLLTVSLLGDGWVVTVDRHIELQVFLHQHSGLRDVAGWLTWLGDPVTVGVVVVASTVVLVVRRDLARAVALPVAVVSTLLVGQVVRHAIGRSSPTFGSHLHVPGGDAYPSGHALGAALCLAAVAVAVRRLWVSWAAVAVAVAVAMARVYLFAHFTSDVLASLLTATAVIAVVEAIGERSPPTTRTTS